MNRFEKAAYFGHVMGKVAAGQGLGAGQSNKEVDDILGSFNDLKKPVDPKALMAERAVHRYEPTFQANPQTRPQLSNKDISGMQSAFGGKQQQKPSPSSFAQKTAPKNPMLSQPPAGPGRSFSNAQIDPAGQDPLNFYHNSPTAHPGPRTVRNAQIVRPGE
jgi:hypothetical protein